MPATAPPCARAIDQHRNRVHLVGELCESAIPRTLRDHLEITTWRLVVRRAGDPPNHSGSDTIDCATSVRSLGRRAADWRPGDVIACEGRLRRRFWRIDGTTVSRCEVDVQATRVVRHPSGRRAADAPSTGVPVDP